MRQSIGNVVMVIRMSSGWGRGGEYITCSVSRWNPTTNTSVSIKANRHASEVFTTYLSIPRGEYKLHLFIKEAKISFRIFLCPFIYDGRNFDLRKRGGGSLFSGQTDCQGRVLNGNRSKCSFSNIYVKIYRQQKYPYFGWTYERRITTSENSQSSSEMTKSTHSESFSRFDSSIARVLQKTSPSLWNLRSISSTFSPQTIRPPSN